MAFAPVQTKGVAQTQNNSQTVTPDATTTAGNLVCVGIKMLDLNETCTSVTDSAGNTYALTSAVDSSGSTRMYAAYGIQVSGATTITANFSGTSTYKRMFIDEFSGFSSGMTNTTAFDTTQTGTGSGTSLAVSTMTPAAAGELIWAVLAQDNDFTFTAGTNYTLYGQGSNTDLRSEYRLSGTTSETAPATTSSSITWAERAITFKNIPPTAGFLAIL